MWCPGTETANQSQTPGFCLYGFYFSKGKLMRIWRDGTATVLTITLLVILVADVAQARLVRGPRRAPGLQVFGAGNELVLEGGLAQPFGDLADDYFTTDQGIEAGTGYELGVRYRHYVGPNWAVSPAFHYLRFGTYSGVANFPEGDDLGFEIRGSQYRYGLDLQLFVGDPAVPARAFVTGGVALAHNIYRDELQYAGVFKEAVNAPAFNAGIGLKLGVMEISGTYHFNRFETSKFTAGPEKFAYNWDYAILRVGFAFGRH
jgi:hypothetical protein